MFIATVAQKNKYGKKSYEYQHLLESVRTDNGPRQKFLLNLGKLDLPKEEWPLLAKRIDDLVRGQRNFFSGSVEIERLASHYAQKFLRRYEAEYDKLDEKKYESIDLNSLENDQVRTIGAEYVGLSYLKKLRIDQCLRECGFTKREVEVAVLLIIGRMVSPGSERHIYHWSRKVSGLDDLLGANFGELSLNTLYSVCDKIYKNKDYIDNHLRQRERDLFDLKEKIVLYDLTNTFLEGLAFRNRKAKFGRSKERRSDCRLLTLGLVIDGKGFPKTSKVFAGNQSEPKSLLEMIDTLREADPIELNLSDKPTIVIDAGIATEENLAELKGSYHYIAVSRKKIKLSESDDFILIQKDKKNKVEAKRITHKGEVFLYCKSQNKKKKEKSMQSRLEQLFEDNLKHMAESIHKKGCTKDYQKVCERIGRLKEKYSRIARYYQVVVEEKDGLANKISWEYIKDQSDERFSGSYYLRTDREDLSEKQIWDIYTMLNEIEGTFRSMKSELEIQPNYHQRETRSDAHIFITVFAYHILHSIRTRLKQVGINYRWETIRKWLSTHSRVTNRMRNKKGKTIYIRKCSNPEYFHQTIYDGLNLDYIPCKAKKTVI